MKLVICIGVAAAAFASAADGAPSGYPSSLAVLGTATANGWGADPAHPFANAPQDSWATGTNPAVRSIYSRLLVLNPAIKGHAFTLAYPNGAPEGAGKELDSFDHAVTDTLRLKMKPELVLVQVIDRALKCDGTTERDFAGYGQRFSASLQKLAQGLPNARIVVIGQWGSFDSYVSYLKSLGVSPRMKNAGKKPCQLVSSQSGQVVASRVAYAKSIVAGEEAQLKAACAQVPNCRYDRGAASQIKVAAADMAQFQYTPTIQGQAKLAAAEWSVIADFLKGGAK